MKKYGWIWLIVMVLFLAGMYVTFFLPAVHLEDADTSASSNGSASASSSVSVPASFDDSAPASSDEPESRPYIGDFCGIGVGITYEQVVAQLGSPTRLYGADESALRQRLTNGEATLLMAYRLFDETQMILVFSTDDAGIPDMLRDLAIWDAADRIFLLSDEKANSRLSLVLGRIASSR